MGHTMLYVEISTWICTDVIRNMVQRSPQLDHAADLTRLAGSILRYGPDRLLMNSSKALHGQFSSQDEQ